ncbi:MAG: hypothetical protein ACJARX_001165 [Psychroserpens sp.]|jgi:hypothetical protein|uniref:cytochrome c oxidase assembly factor Coa1 family protein n=1 Tax=Psychroserpens sp. TaxID=2020870 RepID=UPI0039E46CB1
MNDITMQHKNWLQHHWKWLIPVVVITSGILLFIFSGLSGVTTDISKAYMEKDLFNNAFEKVQHHKAASDVLGALEPTDKLAILEGAVNYSNNNQSVNASIRIVGSKARGKIDITADKINSIWVYQLIKVRVKKPVDKKQTIEVLKLE